MKKIAILKERNIGENRVILLPKDIDELTKKYEIYVEKGAGENIGISDDEYKIEKIDIGIMGEINEESEVKNNKKSKNNVIGIVDSIEKISVDISSKVSKEEKEYVISSKDANTLKEYLSNVYDVNTKNIFIH